MTALRIVHMRVREGRLDIETATDLAYLHVSEQTAHAICQLLPNLSNHICVNEGDSPRFADEIVGTELPHLFEHVVIELQGQAHRALGTALPQLTGHTSWLEELAATRLQGIARMRTTVTFSHDLMAMQAAKEAQALLRWTVGETPPSPMPDVHNVCARVCAVC